MLDVRSLSDKAVARVG